jgi:hypothetical protein
MLTVEPVEVDRTESIVDHGSKVVVPVRFTSCGDEGPGYGALQT